MSEEGRPRRHNILLVDDGPNVLSVLVTLLRVDYNVFSATSGEDALSIMEQNDIALIIADHRMPGMSGSELLEKALQMYPNTIRIILSGYIDQKLLMNAISTVHAHDVLVKPWMSDEVEFTVKRWIEQYEKYSQLEEKAGQCEDLQRQLEETKQRIQQLTEQLKQSQEALESQRVSSRPRWFKRGNRGNSNQ